jgi:hypothetical protein
VQTTPLGRSHSRRHYVVIPYVVEWGLGTGEKVCHMREASLDPDVGSCSGKRPYAWRKLQGEILPIYPAVTVSYILLCLPFDTYIDNKQELLP